MKLDDSGIVFLRSVRDTPKFMTVVLDVPQGGSVSYQIPVIEMQSYTLEYILENKLFILLPFIFFNYEKQLRKAPRDKGLYDEILHLYDSILSNLRDLADSAILTAYEASTLYDALKTVFGALGETNKIRLIHDHLAPSAALSSVGSVRRKPYFPWGHYSTTVTSV